MTALWHLGRLTHNTDLHFGNVSLSIEGEVFRLLPVHEKGSTEFSPPAGEGAHTTPRTFWNLLARNTRIAPDWRAFVGTRTHARPSDPEGPNEARSATVKNAFPRIIAHRGASYAARENTLAAFRLGLEEGADGLEGDFHLTADGVVVCHHDAKLGRVFPGREAVRSTPLSRLRAASGGELPTLAEFLALLPAGIEAFLELKTGPEIVAPIRAALEDWGQPVPGLTLMSFSVATVRAAQAAFPESSIGMKTAQI